MCFFKLNISTYIIKENAFIFSIFVFNQVLSDFNNCLMICSVIVTKKEELCKRVNTLSQLYCTCYDLVGMSAPLRNVTSCFIFLIRQKSRSAIRSILSISCGGKKARCNWHFWHFGSVQDASLQKALGHDSTQGAMWSGSVLLTELMSISDTRTDEPVPLVLLACKYSSQTSC